MTFENASERPFAFITALGLLGGGALITTVSITTRGPMIFLPYAALVLATGAYLRVEKVRPFARRFGLALGAFMAATLILYIFIGVVANARALVEISLVGHAWRLGLMLGIGSLLSAAVAQLTATRS